MVQGRVALEIDGLRRALSSPDLERIGPHVTLVPPVNVPETAVALACDVLRETASGSVPLLLELGPAASFLPVSPVCYLAVCGAERALEALTSLARRLRSGPLATPADRLEAPFVPHVTLNRRMTPEKIALAVASLAGFRVDVVFEDVTLLELSGPERAWSALVAVPLRQPVTVGRGGVEIELSLSDRLDPAAADFSRRASEELDLKQYGRAFGPDEPFAITARVDGKVAGVAESEVRGAVCRLERLIVGARWRGVGVGSQLLRATEQEAIERGCACVRLEAATGSRAEGFYRGRGYGATCTLARWREEPDFVVMERELAGSRPRR